MTDGIDKRPRARFRSASNYVIYYGAGRLDELAMFDVAILESAAYSRDDVAYLADRGSLPIGYLSVMESGEHLNHHKRATAGDFLRVAGSRARVPEFGTWVMDIRSPHWREIVLSVAAEIVGERGFSGLFLDTVNRVEDPTLPRSLSLEMTAYALELITQLRDMHPDAILIQNLGLERLIRRTAPLLDGVCWEGFGHSCGLGVEDHSWIVSNLNSLRSLGDRYGLRIMLLAHTDLTRETETLLETAKIDGLLCYRAFPYSRVIDTSFADAGRIERKG